MPITMPTANHSVLLGERSFHGRPAGFRTHALVCLSTSLLMLATIYQWQWFPAPNLETVRIDPTRMAQGIMTGIGFLGWGHHQGRSFSARSDHRGIDLDYGRDRHLIGIGFYFPALLATLPTLGTLSVFRAIELKMPMLFTPISSFASRANAQYRKWIGALSSANTGSRSRI